MTMSVTISAGDAQGSRNEKTLYQRVSTSATRALLQVLKENASPDEAVIYLADDADTYAFYGELAHDVTPAALQRILGNSENLTAETKAAINEFGPNLLKKLIDLGQFVRINVANSMDKHQATVSTDGTMADEPVMEACHSTARRAFQRLGQDLPRVTEVFTYKARDFAGKDDADNDVRRLQQVAQYALTRFGPEATLLVG